MTPLLQLLFASNSVRYVFVDFEPDNRSRPYRAAKPPITLVQVSCLRRTIVRHAEIKRTVFFAGKEVDVVCHRERGVINSGLAQEARPGMTVHKLPPRTMKGKQVVKISKFDAADYLKTPEAIATYLTEVFATDDAAYICAALDTIARARGMSSVAKETGLSRESLYKSFSGSSKPEFETSSKSTQLIRRKIRR